MIRFRHIAAAFIAFAPLPAHAASVCDMIDGTYVASALGKFDDNPQTLGFALITFVKGNGTGRQTIAYQPSAPSADHIRLAASCTPINATTAMISFKSVQGGTGAPTNDAGSVQYIVFDGGARIWAKSLSAARPLSGWLLKLPPAPRL